MPAEGWDLTICGLTELGQHGSRDVTHVLSILDPDHPDPTDFAAYGREHRRLTLRFHDIIEDLGGDWSPPMPSHVEELLRFGEDLDAHHSDDGLRHLLVHCHAGVSRSTAAMAILMARVAPGDERGVFERLVRIRPQAWPNARMVAFGDGLLGCGGRLVEALRGHYRRQAELMPDLAGFMRQSGRAAEATELAR